jgi:valyl-tRNA synthetase
LRLLSPIMPFLSEEIWQAIYDGHPPKKSIALSAFPEYENRDEFAEATLYSAELSMQHLQKAIVLLRSRRKDLGVDEKTLVKAKVASARPGVLNANAEVVKKLAKLQELEVVSFSDRDPGGRYGSLAWQSGGEVDVYVEFERHVDVPAERERLFKEIARLQKGLASAEKQLGNESFLAKAPPNVVEGLKKQEAETRRLLKKAREALGNLPEEAA